MRQQGRIWSWAAGTLCALWVASQNLHAAQDATPAPAATAKSSTEPLKKPPVVTHEEPLMTVQQFKDLKRKVQIKIARALRNGDMPLDEQLLKDWASWRFDSMTMIQARTVPPIPPPPVPVPGAPPAGKPALPNRDIPFLSDLRASVTREIEGAGRLQNNPTTLVNFRREVCKIVTEKCEVLLQNQLQVRLNAAIILAQLNLLEGDKDKPSHAYAGAAKPLIAVLKAKTGGNLDEQTPAIKLWAAKGLGNIALTARPQDLLVTLKMEMARAIIAELQDPETHWWYQKELLLALASIDQVTDAQSGKPILVEALGKVLVDKNRDLRVRAAAARALGRAALPPNLNADVLAYHIMQLSHEIALEFQKNPNAGHWPACIYDLYYAFRPVTDRERFHSRPPGLYDRLPSANIRDAYKPVLAMAKHIVQEMLRLRSQRAVGPDGVRPIVKLAMNKLDPKIILDMKAYLDSRRPESNSLTSQIGPDAASRPTLAGRSN